MKTSCTFPFKAFPAGPDKISSLLPTSETPPAVEYSTLRDLFAFVHFCTSKLLFLGFLGFISWAAEQILGFGSRTSIGELTGRPLI